MLQALQQKLQQRFQRWLARRIPPSRDVRLQRHNIFIFLSPAGYGFCGLLILLFVIAVNYQNNMVFALLFLLFGLLSVALLHSYKNMSGLQLSYQHAANSFVGDSVPVTLQLKGGAGQSHYGLHCQWSQSSAQLNVEAGAEQLVSLHLKAQQRGWLQPPRLLVESYYPLGLFRCWSWLAIDVQALIYPAPLACQLKDAVGDSGDEGEASTVPGSDDFYGFKHYQPGHSLKHVHWPSYAKGQPLQTKEFAAYSSHAQLIDWASFSGSNEQRLSAICYWVLQFSQQQSLFSVRLPNGHYGPGTGEAFKLQLLQLLALYPATSGGKHGH
ncbi:DUF58 domain-containing protein [Dasania sp. GY-MA-18]|uniref:DUF58 domain-containing protein n=1 Tax=Dasania phycosphaerae TaxID=2950436 RepID=A0A9J6RJK3_9GAMM|nr:MULTISPECIES: DUF58 domain-containing protein [Dasania]MCR8921729.1 DUF58 domain-containing protein [Dasania sp. GY-MA-18]MCZ0864157.1 DUF58 domain-containing protein [Dasania phycosphaerae]MCZ0867885.1 DUF58 domain-containing protein [Dasania phycosphaerae]